MYIYYLGRIYRTWQTLSESEQRLANPDAKIAEMRLIALQYCKDELIGYSLNVFDCGVSSFDIGHVGIRTTPGWDDYGWS